MYKRPAIRSDKIRNCARGNNCTVRIPGVCSGRRDTTVLAHLPGGGVGVKGDDIEAAFACFDCHDTLDGRRQTTFSKAELLAMHNAGARETRRWLFDNGYISVA